jgi:hypothetical protein
MLMSQAVNTTVLKVEITDLGSDSSVGFECDSRWEFRL